MAADRNGQAGASPASAGQPSADGWSKGDPFDIWLQRSLQESFAAIVAEPVPDDLLRLLAESDAYTSPT
jgi:hypothetical protein